jgi:cullin 4
VHLQVQDAINSYQSYYAEKQPKRALHWNHALGTVTMIARFKPGKKELSLSAFQAVILLLFNDVDELPYADIKAQTRLSMSYLIYSLVQLTTSVKVTTNYD